MNKHHIHPETCITDIIHIIYSNVEGQVLILLFLLGFIIKLYDNINDWNRQITTQSCNPKLKIAIINEDITALISHDSQRAKGRTPRINKVSYSKKAKMRRPQVPY